MIPSEKDILIRRSLELCIYCGKQSVRDITSLICKECQFLFEKETSAIFAEEERHEHSVYHPVYETCKRWHEMYERRYNALIPSKKDIIIRNSLRLCIYCGKNDIRHPGSLVCEDCHTLYQREIDTFFSSASNTSSSIFDNTLRFGI